MSQGHASNAIEPVREDHSVFLLACAVPFFATPALADWRGEGLPVAIAPNNQSIWTVHPRAVLVPDGAGGAYITWSDEGAQRIRLQRLNGKGQVSTGWPDAGLDFERPGATQWQSDPD